MKFCAIIPARFASKRLPGKPLLKINNKEILLLTYNRLKNVINKNDIYIFTDSEKIVNRFKHKIKNIFLFKKKFLNGTERASYGTKYLKKKYEAALILSCDNPYIGLETIKETFRAYKLIKKDDNYCAGTVHCKNYGVEYNRNVAKMAVNLKNDILYISRSKIPNTLIGKKYVFSHHGPVCVKMKYLRKYIHLKNTKFQIAEDNEWLKFIGSGYKIKSLLTKKISQEINVASDLKYYRKKYKR